MMQDKKNFSYRLVGLVIGCIVALGGLAISVHGQTKDNSNEGAEKRVRETGRDPFRKYEPPRVVRKTGLVSMPSIEERIAQYKTQKAAAMASRMPAPKPTTAFLLDEIQVVGISRSPRGYAAIIEATPIKLSYVVYPGEKFYNGQLVAIEDNRLVFRRETVFYDGRRERSTELKPLRAPSAVNALSSVKTAAAGETEKRAGEKGGSSEKP